MIFKLMIGNLACMFIYSLEVSTHGRLMDPVSRSSAWRKGFDTERNDNDNELNCGGFGNQYNEINKGKCGPCGDDYSQPQPRNNENGGKYGKGIIVKRYSPGQTINVTVELTTNHLGYFEFSLCSLGSDIEQESNECFDQYRLPFEDGTYKYQLNNVESITNLTLPVVLPKDLLNCEHCVFRWHYNCGNNWNVCEDGIKRQGCGNQENFRGCADISIL